MTTEEDILLQASTRTTFYGISARLFAQLESAIQVLHKAHVPVPGYDVLLARHRAEQQLGSQSNTCNSSQQEQIEKLVAQELLVSQMMQQLTSYSQGLEQLHGVCLKQEQRVSCIENHAADLARQVGQKSKRIVDLEADALSKTSQIQGLQSQVQKYKRVCSFVTHMVTSQELERQEELKSLCLPSQTEATASAKVSGSSPISLSAGVATAKSSSDTATLLHLNHQHSSDESSMGPQQVPPTVNMQDTLAMQELTGTPWLKRMPCLIIGRHPEAPREVTVVCKQISGSLLLGDVKQELRIRSHTEGRPVLSPADFEATAGCSKGKNWKANIRVQGKNGCTQMLKIWLPGLVQLVGDHSKTAIAKSSPITALLDEESGLRIQIPAFPS